MTGRSGRFTYVAPSEIERMEGLFKDERPAPITPETLEHVFSSFPGLR